MTSQNSKSPEENNQHFYDWFYENFSTREDCILTPNELDQVYNYVKERENNRLVLPGYDNQCAHDASPSDFDNGAEYGFNKCLNEIYEMNPYLKLDKGNK
tara:strand:+ start:222 stop:521 length:300 start_codon:yes stop_codon:yes gene_type:complete